MNKILSALLLAVTLMLTKLVQSVTGISQNAENTWQGNRVRPVGAGPRK